MTDAINGVRAQVRAMHVDMVKMMVMQLEDVKAMLAVNSAKWASVVEENDRLKRENARLHGLM